MGIPLGAVGAAGAAVSLKIPGRPSYRTRIVGANVSFSAAPVAAVTLTMTEVQNNTPRVTLDLSSQGPANLYPPENGWEFEVGQDVIVNIAAPGGAVVARLNTSFDYVPELNPYS